MNAIDKVATMKKRQLKRNSQNGLMGKLPMKLKILINYFKKFKKSRSRIDKKIYNAARYKLQEMITNKRRAFFGNKLTESIGKLKHLWKTLKSLGLPGKTSSCEVNALKIKSTLEHDVNSVLQGFRNYYSTLVRNLVSPPEPPSNIMNI